MFRYLRDRMQVTFAGGQDQLKGKIIRVAHLGYVGASTSSPGSRRSSWRCDTSARRSSSGRGVGAAEAILAEGLPAPLRAAAPWPIASC